MVEEARCRYGWPEILSTDQGGRFTNDDLSGTLKDHGIMIAMDRKSLPSRRRRALHGQHLRRAAVAKAPYEEVYRNAYTTVA